MRRAGGGKVAPHLCGIVAVDRHLRVVALEKPDGLAADEVDGRKEDHTPTSSQKARRMASPTVPLFSGWNWQPKTLPRCTAAGSGAP